MPRKPGRPSKLTPQVHQGIVSALKAGAFARHAAGAFGISETTYYGWTARGLAEAERIEAAEQLRDTYKGQSRKRKADLERATKPRESEAPYLEFQKACARATHEAVVTHEAVITKAAREGEWRASSWWLERRLPAEYGQSVKITGDTNAPPVQVAVSAAGADPVVASKAHEFLRAAHPEPREDQGAPEPLDS